MTVSSFRREWRREDGGQQVHHAVHRGHHQPQPEGGGGEVRALSTMHAHTDTATYTRMHMHTHARTRTLLFEKRNSIIGRRRVEATLS